MNRLRIVIILAAALLLGCLAFAFFHSREPRYEGRTLSDWLGTFVLAASHQREGAEPNWEGTKRAVKSIGTNAIPFLLKWLQKKDSPARRNVIAWLEKHRSLHIQIASSWYYHEMATQGFRLLGKDGKPAWPTLIRWTSDPDFERRYWALRCLTLARPDKATILPVLQRALKDPNKPLQNEAANEIRLLEFIDSENATNQPATK